MPGRGAIYRWVSSESNGFYKGAKLLPRCALALEVKSDRGWERRFGNQRKGALNSMRQAQEIIPLHVNNHHYSLAASRTAANTLLLCGNFEPVRPPRRCLILAVAHGKNQVCS